jgi:Carboxypeptidase regulatory-like domain
MGSQLCTRLMLMLVLAVVFGAVAMAQRPANDNAKASVEVQGRVIDADGRPVAGCALAVIEHAHQLDVATLLRSPRFTTDRFGRYRVAMEPGRKLVIAARDRQIVAVRGPLRNSEPVELPPVVLLPGTMLRGRVRDADGEAIPGASVVVEDSLPESLAAPVRLLAVARAGADGIFVVSGVPFTGMQVSVHALGFASVRRLVSHDSPLDVTLAATGIVRGTVRRDDGEPVAGALVHAFAIAALDPEPSIATDSLGKFTMTVPPVARFRVGARSPDWRQKFRSDWLRGACDEVVVGQVEVEQQEAPTQTGPGAATVRCIEAETGTPIHRFHVSYGGLGVDSWASAVLRHRSVRAAAADQATISVPPRPDRVGPGWVVVDAPGRGFAVRSVPATAAEPLLIELQRESVLVGRVVDAETGLVAVGAAVRALPRNSLRGRGPDPFADGVITAADGRYRIEGLPSGEFDVQVYGRGRPAPDSRRCVLEIGTTTTLDLEVPKARFLDLELIGEVPAGCLGQLRILEGNGRVRGLEQGMCLSVGLPLPSDTPLAGVHRLRLGPFDRGELEGHIVLPGRNRTGSMVTIDLGALADGPLQLPDLRYGTYRGRVELPPTVETARIALFARRCREAGPAPIYETTPAAVALRSDGTFAIDLLPGRYAFQVVDLVTGIAFFTERDDRELDSTAVLDPLELRPAIHWLHLDLVPPGEDADVGVSWLDLWVTRHRDAVPVRFVWQTSANGAELGRWPCPAGTRQVHWLLPPGPVKLVAKRVGDDGVERVVGSETVEVVTAEQHLSMRLAPVEVGGLPAGEVGK